MNDTEKIGCCGAYCKTCREFQKTCKGCKLGYWDGSRDLTRAKCKIKRCCLTKGYVTCADCRDYDHCVIIQAFIHHPGYKYAKLTENTPHRNIRTKYRSLEHERVQWAVSFAPHIFPSGRPEGQISNPDVFISILFIDKRKQL